MKHTLPLLLVPALLVCGESNAQTAAAGLRQGEDETRTIRFAKTSQDTVLREILLKERPVENKAIPVPHFALHTPDNKFVMTIGGQINPIVGVDLGNDLYEQPGAGISFVTGQIPVPPVPGKKSDFFINPLNAAIDFQVVGFGGTDNQITGYLKLGTDGITKSVHLSRAYVSWRGLTAGLKLTLLQDDYACQPPTIDPEGPSGCVSNASYEVNYTSRSYKGFRFAVGLDIPTYYASSGRYLGKDFKAWHGKDIEGAVVCDPEYSNQNIPDIPLWVEWSKSTYNRIRLSAVIRNFQYRDMLAAKNRVSTGWGVMLSGNLNPVEPLIFYLQAIYGKGIGNYIQDIAGHPYSYTPSSSEPGRMTPKPMMGLNFGITYNISPKWQINAMCSEARIWNVSDYADEASAGPDGIYQNEINNYKYAVYAAGNVFYNISSYLQVGLEYLYGRRQTWNLGGADNHRIQTQLLFTF